MREEDHFDSDPSDIRETRIAALNERFQESKDRIKLLAMRAREAEASEVTRIEDIVSLLLLAQPPPGVC